MSPKDKIKTEMSGLESLLIVAKRIGNPHYTREIQKDIHRLEKEFHKLHIQTLRPIQNED